MAGAAKSKRQQRIDDMIMQPRVDRVALARIAPADLEDVYDTKGTVTGIQRRTNVFRLLRERGTITPNESAAGAKLVEIFARWKGVAGRPDDDGFGWIGVSSAARPEMVTDRMIDAGKTWREIMSYVGPSSARMLAALCNDIVLGDGAPVPAKARIVAVEYDLPARRQSGAPVVTVQRIEPAKQLQRWRCVVQAITGEKDRDKQAVHVARACADLWDYWR